MVIRVSPSKVQYHEFVGAFGLSIGIHATKLTSIQLGLAASRIEQR